MAKEDGIGIRIFYQSVGQDVMDALFNSAEQGKKTAFKQEIRDLYAKGNEQIKSTVGAIQAALSEQQADSVVEILSELSDDERALVNSALSEVELHQVNEIERLAV
jgi:predicted ATP-dependent endonuclease of OLD family